MTMDEIIRNMVGREMKEKFPRVECEKGKKIFEEKSECGKNGERH